MKSGKLNTEQLKENVLSVLGKRRAEVLVPAGAGEDCAVIKPDGLVFLTCDPITGAGGRIGALAVYVSTNDLAAAGAEPAALLLTLIMPEDSGGAAIKEIMKDAERAAKAVGADIVGGHTEFSSAVNRPVICAAAAGFAPEPVNTSGARPGDRIYMTKYAGLEGTFISLTDGNAPQSAFKIDCGGEMRELEDLLSVLPESRILRGAGVTSMHDITEGGVFGAVKELAECAGAGAVIYAGKIPVLPVTGKRAAAEGLNPFTMLSSGSMLFCAGAKEGAAAVALLCKSGINAAEIGEITSGGGCTAVLADGERIVL